MTALQEILADEEDRSLSNYIARLLSEHVADRKSKKKPTKSTKAKS